MDLFALDAGLLSHDGEIDDEVRKALREAAARYLAVGIVTPEYWRALTPESRDALVWASEQIEQRRAELVAAVVLESLVGDVDPDDDAEQALSALGVAEPDWVRQVRSVL